MKSKTPNKNLAAFLLKYSSSLTKQCLQTPPQQIKANILTLQQCEQAAHQIQQGQLVAFPTETVYGLGANAFDEDALRKIYQVKKRPLTDPIIVHVLDAKQGQQLVIMSEKERKLYQLLTKQFWPGPLTIILKANLTRLPLIVTAQTGYVGIRAPQHPFARKLIQLSKYPIGAPSANLFSHVSPTQPVHVFNDFYDCQIYIVDGERCKYGVQSTVVKIVGNAVQVFREGSLSVVKLQAYLKLVIKGENDLPSVVVHRKLQNSNVSMQSPGQLLKHYAPYLPCYYYTSHEVPNPKFHLLQQPHIIDLSQIAFISFSKQKYSQYSTKAKHYFQIGYNLKESDQGLQDEEDEEIFCSKQEKSRMREIYYLLRKCQNMDVKLILVGWSGKQEGTMWDKIFRSTQGQQLSPL